MATIYLRNIPDDNVATLKEAARAENLSLNSYVATMIDTRAKHVRNMEQLRKRIYNFPGRGVKTKEILEALHESRAEAAGGAD